MDKSVKLQLIIEAVNKAGAALGDVRKYLQDGQADTEKLDAKSRDLTGTMSRLAASMVSVGAAWAAIKAGISYLSQIETATLGIAAAYMTGGQYIDATTKKAITADAALQAAQKDSKGIIQELQYANLQTIATLDELINAYQTTLPVALAKGFDRQQVKDFTVAMVQAAGAIGLPMNQMAEETRSILTGAIDARTSRIATVLGLRNEDIAEYKGNAKGLFDFLMDKLSAYRVAGMEAQKTWAGLWSNTKDIAAQALGQGIQPLFDAIKYELTAIAAKIVTIDDKSKSIKWDPEFLDGVKSIRDGLTTIVAEFYRIGMLLDKIGGSGTTIAAAWHDFRANMWEGELAREKQAIFPDKTRIAALERALREQQALGNKYRKANDDYRTRYMASEKALQDMALREQGWKPVTPDIDKRMQAAARKGKRIFDQEQVNVGNPEEGTQQLLRYYREINAKDPIWKPHGEKPDADALKKAQQALEHWRTTVRGLSADIAGAGLDDFENELIEIGKRAGDLREKAKLLPEGERPAAEETITLWQRTEEDKAASKAANKDLDLYLDQVNEVRKAEKSWIETNRKIDFDIGTQGLSEFELELARIWKEADEEREKIRLLPAEQRAPAEKKIALWKRSREDDAAFQAANKDLDKALKGEKDLAADRDKNARNRQTAREADIQGQLAILDLAEAEGKSHRETIAERVRLMSDLAVEQQGYLAGLDKAKDPASWYAQADAIRRTRIALAGLREEQLKLDLARGLAISLKQTGEQLTDMFSQVDGVVKKTFAGMTDALTEFVMTGKLSFSDLANSIIRDMIRIMVQQQITGPLAKAMGGINWAGIFYSSAAAAAGGAGGAASIGSAGAGDLSGITADVAHAGGVMKEVQSYRIVPSAAFDFAPRYHNGIGPGERAAIIREDEGVFTPGQMRALGRNWGRVPISPENENGNPSPITNTVVNIHVANTTGLPLNLKQTGVQQDEKRRTRDIFLELAVTDLEFINHMKGAIAR